MAIYTMDDPIVVMAKNRKPSRYRGYRKLPVTQDVSFSTLAADALIGTVLSTTFTEERRILSAELTWAVEDLTDLDGPLEVGIAHSDYTDAEVEEALEAGGAWDEGNLVAQEQAKRLVRMVGLLTEEETTLNDGQPVKTRLNWRMASGDTIRIWCRNRGDQLTTGAVITTQGSLHTVLV